MQGSMQDYPLTLPPVFDRVERLFPDKTIVTGTATGRERTTYGEWADETRRLGGVLDKRPVLAVRPAGCRAPAAPRAVEIGRASCRERVFAVV